MNEAVNVQAYKAHQVREAAFEQWWKLSLHNGTLPEHGRRNLAREAYFAAWGGFAAQQDGAEALWVCTGCGTMKSIEQIRGEHPEALSCCPERKMAPRQLDGVEQETT